ncbi:hypothetical protein [Dubosiella newyorkensis]|uniref:hypothetical protein n=1 Tax=Dubosiella newyorkensis TaxID=1862672 RepID=UPI0023F15F9F|nr:hypothetical protein [Dubosiella newyorkensis]
MHFEIFSADSQEIKQKLEAGLLDLGFLIEPVEKKEYEWIRLGSCDLMGLILLREDPLAKKKHIQKKMYIRFRSFFRIGKRCGKRFCAFLKKKRRICRSLAVPGCFRMLDIL